MKKKVLVISIIRFEMAYIFRLPRISTLLRFYDVNLHLGKYQLNKFVLNCPIGADLCASKFKSSLVIHGNYIDEIARKRKKTDKVLKDALTSQLKEHVLFDLKF